MGHKTYITDPGEEIKSLVLLYVQSQDISNLRPEAVLNLYDDALRKMWEHFEKNYQ